MRDLTDRALDTAAALGADVRRRPRRPPARGVASPSSPAASRASSSGESEGFGVRVLVDGAWGFASSNWLTATEADRVAAEAVRIARASATALRNRVDPRRPPAGHRALRDAGRRWTRSRSRSRRKIADLLAADQAANRVKGIAFTETTYGAQREWKTFAAIGRQLHRAGHHPCRRRRRGRTPSTATSSSAAATRTPAVAGRPAGYEYIRGLDLAGAAEPLRRGGGRAADRAAVPARPAHDHPRPVAALPPGPRELRPPDRARSRLRHRGELRRDQLPDHRPPRRGVPLRLGPHRRSSPTRRRPAAWARSAGTTRASPPRPCRSSRTASSVGYLSSRETAPRIGRQSGGAMRADGWNRIPLIRMTNINLLPVPGMSLDEIVADTDDGLYLASNRSWSIDDRRLNFQFATEVAYEIKGGQKGRLLQQPDLHRHHLRVLAVVRRGRRRAQLRDARDAELRQGRTRPDRPRRPRGAGRPVPQRPGRGRQRMSVRHRSAPPPAPLAEKVAAGRRAGRRHRGRGARPGRRLRPDPVRQQRDPPERRRDERDRQPAVRRRPAGRRRDDRPDRRRGPASRSSNRPRPSPGSSRSSRTGAACPSPAPMPRRRRRLVARPPPSPRPSRAPRASGRSSPPPTRPAASAYGSFATGAETDRRRQLEGHPRRPAPDDRPAPDRLDGAERRHRLRRGRRRRRRADRSPRRSAGKRPRRRARPQNPVAVDAGDWPVVLEEYAVVDILDMLGYLGFSALAVQEERSFYEPGRAIGSDLVTMVDDPFDPDGLPMAFDYEGVAEGARVARRGRASASTSSTTRRPPRAPGAARPATACRPRTRTARSR